MVLSSKAKKKIVIKSERPITPRWVFPVAYSGNPTFRNDWGDPRSDGRTHKGTDIFAAKGTPVLAVEDGYVSYLTGRKLGGNVAILETAKDRYSYSHLDGFEGEARNVKAGDVIGYVGNTGNAYDTPPHLHFQYHPGKGEAVNPYPLLREAFDA